jgi:hypothetical protein
VGAGLFDYKGVGSLLKNINRSSVYLNLQLISQLSWVQPQLLSMMIILSKMERVFAGCLLLTILCLLAIPAHLFGAQLVNIVIRNFSNELIIDIKLKDVFTEDLKAALSKGIPIDIAFSVSLFEVHNFWFDKKMIGKTAIHQVRFDTLKQVYKIQRSWQDRGFIAEKKSKEAQRIMSEIKGLKVIPLTRLEKGTQYQLRIKSELQDRSYPYTGTPWEFETDWYTINFIY